MTTWTKLLGLESNPVPHPFHKTPSKDKPRTAARAIQPDNLVYHAGRAFTQEQTSPDTVEDTIYNGAGSRFPDIAQADKDAIYDGRLDEERYRTLKPYWVSGLSAQEAAKLFRGKYGFSPRTLDNYWKAFNAAQAARAPSPAG